MHVYMEHMQRNLFHYLNDTEDYEIYKSYFGYYNQNLNRYHDESKTERVKGNSVVTLEENNPADS